VQIIQRNKKADKTVPEEVIYNRRRRWVFGMTIGIGELTENGGQRERSTRRR